MLALSIGLVPPAWSAPAAGKLPDAHTITITVSRDKEQGETGGKKNIITGGGPKDMIINTGDIKDIMVGGKKTGGGSKASGKLPNAHTITITVSRDKKKPASGKKPEEVALPGGGPKDITGGGGGSGNRQKPEQSTGVLPGLKHTAGCDFPKPQIVGEGKPGLEGLPKNFPLPPGIENPWKHDVTSGSLYGIGVTASQKDTVDFLKKELPANGWKIDKETKTQNPFTNSDSVHFFFSNKDYCGWATISATVPQAPTPTVLNIGIKKRAES